MVRKAVPEAVKSVPVLLLAVLATSAAASPEQPVFPAAVVQVRVEAVVLDGRGRPVTGLAREDFVLAEDGALQTIDSFDGPGARPTTTGDTTAPSGAPRSSIAIVVDDLGLTYQQGARSREALSSFARSGAGADLVLLATTSGRERWAGPAVEGGASLAGTIARLSGLDRRDASSAPMTDAEACLIHVAHDAPTLARVEARYRSAGAGDTLRAGLGPFVQAEATAACQRAQAHARRTLTELERAASALGRTPGRRSAVLVSSGLLHDEALPELRRLLETSRSVNVPVYFLDASALEAATSFAGRPESQFGPADEMRAGATSLGPASAEGGRDADLAAVAGAAYVAEETGGLAVRRTNDLAAGLGRIAGDARGRYLLGYVPQRPAEDGKYRSITVRLSPREGTARKGWTVRARRGYYPAPSTVRTAERVSAPDVGSLRLRLSAEPGEDAAEPGRVRCLLTTSVDLSQVPFREVAGRQTAHLDATFEVSAGGTATPMRFEKPVDLDLLPTARLRRDRWLPVQLDIALARGLYQVTATVRDAASGRNGTSSVSLEVPPPSAQRLSDRIVSAEPEVDDTAGPTTAQPPAADRPVDPELTALLAKAGRYVVEYESAFRNIVAEEEYVQRTPGLETDGPDRRTTRADLVFVRLAGPIPWASFRDVYEVDGKAVREHTSRLERLFTERAASALERADAILAESTRYNIGVERTVNLPTLPLLFLHPRNQPRFAFERRGRRMEPGRPVEVSFREVARPTFIRNRKPGPDGDRDDPSLDLPADGRFWINPTHGTVVRSEVRLRTGWSDAEATLTTRFRPEPSLAMWVPEEMKERYEVRASRGTGAFSYGLRGGGGVLEAVARYSHMRRFEVTTEETVRLPKR
jgi:VWFA-related protein